MVGLAVMPTHRTYRLIVASQRFAVCWLSYDDLQAAMTLGESSGQESGNKLATAGLSHHRGTVLDVPIPERAYGWLECSVVWSRQTGDHEFFVADVKAAYADEDFRDYWSFERYRPIVYVGKPSEQKGRYTAFSV